MIFEFGGTPELPSPREAVWRHLQDGETMAACTPGAESFDVRGPGRYSVTCSVGSGLVRVHVVLEAELHDLHHPERLTLRATGTAPGSTLDVQTMVRLEVIDAERTRLDWSSVTAVHGMLAGFGRGMIEETLRQFTERFWANVATKLAAAPRSGPYRLDAAGLLAIPSDTLQGAVLLGGLALADRRLPKGHRLDAIDAAMLRDAAAAGALPEPVRLAWIGPHELHETEAAHQLATAAAGPGTVVRAGTQGRVDLLAGCRGVLTLDLTGINAINAIDPLELFTRWQSQPVEEGEVVAGIKVAPHVVAEVAVAEGAQQATAHAPLISVRPYAGLSVAAVATEPLTAEALDRFEAASRLRAESLGGSFLGIRSTDAVSPEAAERQAREALEEFSLRRRAGVLLIGGVSAGDPLAPFFAALDALGGKLIRHGVPAHPGSMVWLARLGNTQLLGLPRCGAFGFATAADLLLPRIMTGEQLSPGAIAPMGHGGMLGPEMRFRFPSYAQRLPEPPAS